MIRVQPARSRIEKQDTPDKLTLTLPAKGPWSAGGLIALACAVWVGLCAWGCQAARARGQTELAVVAAVVLIPGVIFLFVGLSWCRRRWTLERTAEWLTYRNWGLFGASTRRWAAEDVSSLWIRQSTAVEYVLVVGFRNGRSEDILSEDSEEDLRWAATMLSDLRGTRRAVPAAPQQSPEPARVRTNEAIVPATLSCRKMPTGVEVSFLPLIHFKGRWWKLPGLALLGLTAILGVSSALLQLTHGAFPPAVTRLAVVALFGALVVRFWILNHSGVIQILDGIVTVTQNHGQGHHRLAADTIEFIQTYTASGRTELQFLRRGQEKLRLLSGRPAEELEWAARFLRVALRNRPEEAASPMKMDAAVGDCQVCSEKMESRVVYCAKCRTPHHEECWTYVGTCSTYGCREIRFTRS